MLATNIVRAFFPIPALKQYASCLLIAAFIVHDGGRLAASGRHRGYFCLLAGSSGGYRFSPVQGGRRGFSAAAKRQLLDLALNNMTQGVVMFDATGRLVVCNDRYREIYGFPADVIKPGATLSDVIGYRSRSGSLQRDPAQYLAELMELIASGKTSHIVAELPDGRAIAVVNRPIPGGAYWIGTHHDITERRKIERKNALLSEQQARRAMIDEAIAWFRQSVEGVLSSVASGVAAMKSTATALSATSNDTSAHTAGAVQTSSAAHCRVNVASAAAEELSSSIAEINRQLLRASEVVRAAAEEAQSTDTEIAGSRSRPRRRSTMS